MNYKEVRYFCLSIFINIKFIKKIINKNHLFISIEDKNIKCIILIIVRYISILIFNLKKKTCNYKLSPLFH